MDRYFEAVAVKAFRSEAAEAVRGRLLKNRDKLFTFICHDGVSWNNNLAENAIRQFAYSREDQPGRLRESGLADYLVLLSLYHRAYALRLLRFLVGLGGGSLGPNPPSAVWSRCSPCPRPA